MLAHVLTFRNWVISLKKSSPYIFRLCLYMRIRSSMGKGNNIWRSQETQGSGQQYGSSGVRVPEHFLSLDLAGMYYFASSSRALGNKTAFLSLHREDHSETRPARLSKLLLTLTLSLWSTSPSCRFRAGTQMLLSFQLNNQNQNLSRDEKSGWKNQSECWIAQGS